MIKIKGAIFDVDGVLLDSMGIWDDVADRYLKKLGYEPEPGLRDILFPMSVEEGAVYVKEHYHLSQQVDEIASGVIQIVEEFYMQEVPLKPGVGEFLMEMKGRNIPMAVATSSDKSHIRAAFTRLQIMDYFKEIHTCAEVGAGKSEPKIYKEAAASLGTKPEETVVFEDALHAIRTAKQAGFPVVGVYDAANVKDEAQIQSMVTLYLKEWDCSRMWEYFVNK